MKELYLTVVLVLKENEKPAEVFKGA